MSYELSLVTSADGKAMPPALLKLCQSICEAEGIPPSGLTILGGKPYVNVSGLDARVQKKAADQSLVYQGLSLEPVTTEDKFRREYKATITFFDKAGFLAALASIGNAATPETVKELREAFTQRFSDIGSASPESIKMGTMKNADDVVMMASRRATNRAKRAATGTGLTSVDEVDAKTHGSTQDEVIDIGRVQSEPSREGSSVGESYGPGAGEVTAPCSQVAGSSPAPPPKPSECISEAQRKLLFAMLWAGGKKDKEVKDKLGDALHRIMFEACGVEHTEHIRKADFNKLLIRLPDINPACADRIKELLEKGAPNASA